MLGSAIVITCPGRQKMQLRRWKEVFYLMTLSVVEIKSRRWWVNGMFVGHRWNDADSGKLKH